MYRVSVIMPVYNNEETLERAVESILNQTMPGIELILINDGSTDRSAQICDTYAKTEPLLVEVIHQKHQGISSAYNAGLLKSSGKYVYFAHPNDQFDRRLLEANVKLAQEKEAGVVVFGFSTQTNDYSQETDYHLPRMPLITSRYEFRNHFRNFYHFYPFELFNKIYKRDYLFKNHLTFRRYSTLSEYFFNLNVFRNLGSVVFNRGMYMERGNPNSTVPESIDNDFDMHRIFIQEFHKMIQYWGYEIEYLDLLAEEYYHLVYNELRKVTGKFSSLTYEEQIEHMADVLNHEDIKSNVGYFTLLKNKTVINQMLLKQFRRGNGKGAVDSITRRDDTEVLTGKMKTFLRNFLD